MFFIAPASHNPGQQYCELVSRCRYYGIEGNYFPKNGFRYTTVRERDEKTGKCVEVEKYNYKEEGNWQSWGTPCKVTSDTYLVFLLGGLTSVPILGFIGFFFILIVENLIIKKLINIIRKKHL
jgi:hypothetical protein